MQQGKGRDESKKIENLNSAKFLHRQAVCMAARRELNNRTARIDGFRNTVITNIIIIIIIMSHVG